MLLALIVSAWGDGVMLNVNVETTIVNLTNKIYKTVDPTWLSDTAAAVEV